MENLSKEIMLLALENLDQLLSNESKENKVQLIMGGGGALILAHTLNLATTDIDAIPVGIELHQLDLFVKQVSKNLNIAADWLNPYFYTFTHTLPQDYGNRLISVYQGTALEVLALGKEEMLIMKCFAHRPKDLSHAKALIKKGLNFSLVENHIESLVRKNIPGAQEALDFFDELKE